MRHRDFSFTLALLASLVAHGWLLSKGVRIFIDDNLAIHLDGYGNRAIQVAVKPDEELGDKEGVGDAIDYSPGETPLQARPAEQTQILGSLDPQGAGEFRDRPSMSVLPTGGSITPPVREEQEQATLGVTPKPVLDTPEGFVGLKAKPTPAPQEPTNATASETIAQPPTQSAVASIAGAPLPSADPAPQAETESDPVSVAGGAFFRNGQAMVQFGRKHRLTAPRLTLAAKTDLLQIRGAVIVVLKIKLDEKGDVTNVDIFRSSGSSDIDQSCRVEAYNWWMEPKVNKNNQPVPDEFLFTIRIS
jgi:TonB family protein